MWISFSLTLFAILTSPIQLPFSLVPLLHATTSEKIMGQFKNSVYVLHQYAFYVAILFYGRLYVQHTACMLTSNSLPRLRYKYTHVHSCTVPSSKVGGALKVAFFLLQNLENFSMDYLYCSYGSQCLLHCCSSGKSIVACQLCDTVSLVSRPFSREGRVNVNKRRVW